MGSHRSHLPRLQAPQGWEGHRVDQERWEMRFFFLLKEELRNAVIFESSDLLPQVWLSPSPHNNIGMLSNEQKMLFIWMVPVDQTDSWGAQRWGWGAAQLPSPTRAQRTLLAGQGPNPAPQPATELALHPCIHSNSPVLLENWERRGQKRSTPEPFGQPAQGQELPDVGPHQELPQALLQTGRKALYQASAEGFYTKNSHPSNLSYHPPHCESASDLKQWGWELIRNQKCCACPRTGSAAREQLHTNCDLSRSARVTLCLSHVIVWGDMSHHCHGDMSPHYCAAIMDIQLKALTTTVST